MWRRRRRRRPAPVVRRARVRSDRQRRPETAAPAAPRSGGRPLRFVARPLRRLCRRPDRRNRCKSAPHAPSYVSLLPGIAAPLDSPSRVPVSAAQCATAARPRAPPPARTPTTPSPAPHPRPRPPARRRGPRPDRPAPPPGARATASARTFPAAAAPPGPPAPARSRATADTGAAPVRLGQDRPPELGLHPGAGRIRRHRRAGACTARACGLTRREPHQSAQSAAPEA